MYKRQAPDIPVEEFKQSVFKAFSTELPITEEQYRRSNPDQLVAAIMEEVIANLKRRSERMAEVTYPVLKAFYDQHGDNVEMCIRDRVYGDAAYWIDEYSARWASSTYYSREFPWYIDKTNSGTSSLPSRLSSGITWQPLSTQSRIPTTSTFNHSFRKTTSDIADFKDSPLVNDEVVSLAHKLFESTQLGKDETPDLLSLHPVSYTHLDVYKRQDCRIIKRKKGKRNGT